MILIEIVLFAVVGLLILNLVGPKTRSTATEWLKATFGPFGEGIGKIVARVGEINPIQFGILATLGLFLLAWALELPALLGIGLAAIAVVLFSTAWYREFRFLMQLTDADFPGRFDKPIWAALLILLPPAGLLAFSAYRRSTWTEAKPAMVADLS